MFIISLPMRLEATSGTCRASHQYTTKQDSNISKSSLNGKTHTRLAPACPHITRVQCSYESSLGSCGSEPMAVG